MMRMAKRIFSYVDIIRFLIEEQRRFALFEYCASLRGPDIALGALKALFQGFLRGMTGGANGFHMFVEAINMDDLTSRIIQDFEYGSPHYFEHSENGLIILSRILREMGEETLADIAENLIKIIWDCNDNDKSNTIGLRITKIRELVEKLRREGYNVPSPNTISDWF